MDEIIKALSQKLNLPEESIRSGIATILRFLKERAAGTEFEKFVSAIPGADNLAASAAAAPSGGASGLLGGLLGNMGGLAEAAAALQKAGIPIDKAAPLASGFLDEARSVVGPEKVDALLAQVPALKALLSTGK